MAIQFPEPPKSEERIEWSQWYDKLWRKVRGEATTTGDVAATVGNAATYHGVTALTAPRIITLSAADTLQDGDRLIVQDESGAAGTHTITITANGTDTINAAATVTITTNFGRRELVKRGKGQWFSH